LRDRGGEGEALIAALRAGRRAGLVTVFNSAPAPSEPLPDELYMLCDIICPNETETALLTGMPTNTLEQCEAAARAIIKKGAKSVVLTLGERGCMLVREGNVPALHVPVPEDMRDIKVLDTTGAGDGFLGGLAHLVASGLPLVDALPGAVQP
jgi:ribokinase